MLTIDPALPHSRPSGLLARPPDVTAGAEEPLRTAAAMGPVLAP